MSNPFSRARGTRPFEAAPQAEVDDELTFHLEARIRDYVARGMDPAEARAAALARFGDVCEVRAECTQLLEADRRAADRRDWFDDLRQDLRYGVRSLRRAPLFTLLAVVTLALGIGANAAVFGVVKSVLLDALPYAGADRVMRVYGTWANGTTDRGPMSVGTLRDVRARQRSFERTAIFEATPREATLLAGDDPRVVKLLWAEPELFRTLGVAAGRGRLLRDEDMQPNTAWNVVMTHAAWQRHFGGDPAMIGSQVRVNGIPRTVVGVLPRGFVGPEGAVDFYFPLLGMRQALADPDRVYGRQNYGMVGRLRPAVTFEAARAEVAAIAADIARAQPRFNSGVSLVSIPVRDAMVGDTRTPLLVLMASAGLVLVITCANLAGAMLSRTLSRRKEFAVRSALGAGRGRLVRQLLTESTVLSLAGGGAGVLLALLALRALRGQALTALPSYAELSLDGGALLVTAAVAVATGLAFGLAPALSVSRDNVQGTLREEGRGASESARSRALRGLLVSGQIALCVSILAGAGLLARSLMAMTAAPLGFEPRQLLAASVQLPSGGGYGSAEGRVRFIEEFEERLRALPGVVSVATAGDVPTRAGGRNGVAAEGAPPPPPGESMPLALHYTVSESYFRTTGIPLRGGRTFGAEDRVDGPPVIIVSEGLARCLWPGADPVGRRLKLGPEDDAPAFTVVGVVGDVANDPAKLAPDLATYMPLRQQPWNGPVFLIRTQGDAAPLAGAVRRALAQRDRLLPLREALPMDAIIADGLSGRRLPVMLMTGFGALALLLASVGVYAMFASMAAAREREFGVRVALGASPGGIATLVLRQGGAWMVAGLVGGAVGVVIVTGALRSLLFGVSRFDPVALGIALAALLACASLTLLVPVRRASRVDPITTLR
ncbi:MAG: ADOP family duplicated permease [Gemmatirosa sp.]